MRLNGSILRFTSSIFVLAGFLCLPLKAQDIVVAGGAGKIYPAFDHRVDALVMFNGITLSSEIKVETNLAVEWYEYYNKNSTPDFHSSPQFISNQLSIIPDDHAGYLVKISGMVDGVPYSKSLSVFVIDYQKYRWSEVSVVPIVGVKPDCEQLLLELRGNLAQMNYATPAGLLYPVDRVLNLRYETLEWNEQWIDREITTPVRIESGQIEVDDPPLKDTYFEVTGDQFSQDLGVGVFSFRSSLYSARRVACKITTEATVRSEKHEVDRPESKTAISGSAPLELVLKANGNEPVSNYYNWTIQSGDEVLLSRTDASHTYTFLQAGTFLVKVRAENAYCSFTDSITVKISESAISAPNVFSPNGDDINDEFRVAYKSIIEFQGIIFNRWGTKIFEWTDIQKGWNGTRNGKPVNEGAYFYVIRARGSDDIIYNLKGDINLLRGKK